MATNIVDVSPFNREELKSLGATSGPCLTILLSLRRTEPNHRHAELTLKSSLQNAEQLMAERGLDRESIDSMLAPVREFAADSEVWAQHGEGVALFRSPDLFRWFPLSQEIRDEVVFADHFYMLPLLPSLASDQQFYILALSQKHVRLIRCTDHSSEEVPLPESVPTNLEEFLQLEPEGEMLTTGLHPGPGTNSFTKAVTYASNDTERKDEYLHHFYKAVTRGVQDVLKEDPAPVVPAGVDYEIGVFRRANMLEHASEHAVYGSADGLKGGDLHARALEAVAPEFEAPLRRALDLYEKQGGSDKTTSEPRQVVKAAFEGRVAHLFLAEGERLMGNFDEEAHRVHMPRKARSGDEDLLNAAALQTMLHGGEVFVIPKQQIPGESEMAAVLRW